MKIKIPCTLMQWTRFSSWTRFWNLESEVTMTRLLIQREMRSLLCFPVIDSVTITRPGTSEPWRKFLEANIFGKFEANPFHSKNSRIWLEQRSLLFCHKYRSKRVRAPIQWITWIFKHYPMRLSQLIPSNTNNKNYRIDYGTNTA